MKPMEYSTMNAEFITAATVMLPPKLNFSSPIKSTIVGLI